MILHVNVMKLKCVCTVQTEKNKEDNGAFEQEADQQHLCPAVLVPCTVDSFL